MKQLQQIRDVQIEFFKTQKTKSVEFRLAQLKNLKEIILNHEDDILNALYGDLNKSKKEAFISEFMVVLNELDEQIRSLKKWSKPKKVKNTYETMGCKSWISHEPKGLVVIISPFNYPFQLALVPLIGAIAAGNTVLLKPSKNTPYTNQVIETIVDEAFHPKHVCFLKRKMYGSYQDIFDIYPNMVFFTGSNAVGTTVAVECAKRNIEYITEMGGKSPCVIDETANLKKVVKRIVWSKLLNAGQTCVSVDYVLVHKYIYDDFLKALIAEIKVQYPNSLKTKNIPRIISKQAFKNLTGIIDRFGVENIIYGGKSNAHDLLIEPTILRVRYKRTLYSLPEIFGPLITVFEYSNQNEMLDIISKTDNTPLAAYFYGEDKTKIKHFSENVQAGSICINDSIVQILNHRLPFGGFMTSGFGNYHGYHSFKSFSHTKPITINKSSKNLAIKYINNHVTYEKAKKSIYFIRKFIH